MSIASLERAIRDTRERIEQDERERTQHAELAAQAEQEKRSVADDAAAFNKAAQKVKHHSDEVERLGLVLERRVRELAELESSLGMARYENGRAAYESALARQHDASKKFAAAIVMADKAVATLVAARDEVDAARSLARELCPADIDFEPAGPDEPEWPAVGRLLETLQTGPRRPLARDTDAVERRRRERASAEHSRIPSAVKEALETGDFERLRKLDPGTLPAALAHAEREVRARLDRISQGEGSREIVNSLERRLERVRELADEAEIAA